MEGIWEVVGGTDTGGIIVRKGADVKSEAEPTRLATGALVEGLALRGDRLNYRRLEGSGPATGWVTVKLKTKDLVVRTARHPPQQQAGDAAGRASLADSGVDQNASAAGAAESEDIFAALCALERTGKEPGTAETTAAPLVDRLFEHGDADDAPLREMLAEIARAAEEDSAVPFLLWRRALPLLLTPGERARRPNLFGLLVDFQCGLLSGSQVGKSMNDVACDAPEQADLTGLVIFLFGWGGGKVQDLDDVCALYRRLYPGSVVVRLTCNAKASFGLRCECAYAMKAASQAWAHAPADATPKLLVHLFSNAGFMTWTEMLESWDAICSSQTKHPSLVGPLPRMAEVLRGVILDSACNARVPLESAIQSQVQGMAGLIFQVAASDHDESDNGKKAAERNGKKAMLVLLSDQSPVKAHLAKKPADAFRQVCDAETDIVHRLEPAVELQFIYSRDDAIICCHGIEEYIDEVIARPSRQGFPTPQSLVFDKSKHVFHKQVHKDAYWTCVERFSSSVLGK